VLVREIEIVCVSPRERVDKLGELDTVAPVALTDAETVDVPLAEIVIVREVVMRSEGLAVFMDTDTVVVMSCVVDCDADSEDDPVAAGDTVIDTVGLVYDTDVVAD